MGFSIGGARRCSTCTADRPAARDAYVLLETVMATGLLLIGLSVIGAQIQEADTTVRKMDLRLRAVMLAEMQLAELELGLVKFDSLDEIEEEDFGPRFRDWGWRLTILPTAIEKMYSLQLDVLYAPREAYEEDGFEFDDAETIYTVFAMRPTPQPLNLITDFGLSEQQAVKIDERFQEYNLDPADVLPTDIVERPVEEMLPLLASLLQATGLSSDDVMALLPPEARAAIEQLGGLEELLGKGEGESDKSDPTQQPEQPGDEEIPDE